jgi:hypothetical protein
MMIGIDIDEFKDMMFVKYIFETYPDAMIIQTHRHPSQVLASWCELVAKMRAGFSNDIDKVIKGERKWEGNGVKRVTIPQKEIGESQLKALQEMVESVHSFCQVHPELADRFIDVKYPFSFNFPLFHFD